MSKSNVRSFSSLAPSWLIHSNRPMQTIITRCGPNYALKEDQVSSSDFQFEVKSFRNKAYCNRHYEILEIIDNKNHAIFLLLKNEA